MTDSTGTTPSRAQLSNTHVSPGVLITAVVLVALNLRAVLSSLPTVAIQIQETTGWSDSTLGILTTIPVMCMGVMALTVPSLIMHFGRKQLVVIALVTLATAMLLRAIESVSMLLFLSALLAGIGIALIAGVIPGIVREQLPHRLGQATALWTAAMMTSAALGAALTVPIAGWLGSWSLALAFWCVPAFIALGFWLYAERAAPNHDRPKTLVNLRSLPWRNKLAWALALNMTVNSIVFYSAVAWIAPSYVDRGYSQESAGWLFGLFASAQIVAALLLAGFSPRIKYRRTLFSFAFVATAVALITVGWFPSFSPWIVMFIFGFFISGSFAMTLGLLSEYSQDAPGAARLTAMGFFITYTIGALGPYFSGLLLDIFDSWQLVFSALAVIALSQLLFVAPLRRGAKVE